MEKKPENRSIFKNVDDLRKRTGLSVIQNPYTLGADVVDIHNKRLFSGDDISCWAFIMRYDEKLRELVGKVG